MNFTQSQYLNSKKFPANMMVTAVVMMLIVVMMTNIMILLLLLLFITFILGIYNYIPETNHVSRVYNAAAILCLQFVEHNTLLLLLLLLLLWRNGSGFMIYFRNSLLSFAASNQCYILALRVCETLLSTPFMLVIIDLALLMTRNVA
jgi:hypothetical protein